MTLRQLEVFQAIARNRSFSLAAKRIHLSQPTLSEHVRELEEELGHRLFVRKGRVTLLSEAGRVFETYAARVAATVADGRRALDELDGLRKGSLVIGSSTTPGIYLLPRVVGAFRVRHPGIDLRLDIANSREIEDRVRANELDLGVVGGHELAAGEECLAAGLVDELVLVVPRGHRWARQRAVSPSRLAEEPLLLREDGSATRRVTEQALAQAGVRFTPGMQLGHTEAIKQAVSAGLGVAFVSVYAVMDDVATRRLAALRLRGLRIHRHFHLIHNEARTLSASARAFMRALDQAGKRG
ncbi:MAG: LysR family transcriptional regulator [Candidatus Rokuibacteriota bacterium]|nr:MAG: LysR family transcriptional regulator [Candidatus Rokubacteria bacterium]